VRTTVTLDEDVRLLLNREIRRSGLSFKEALNQALRRGLIRPRSTAAKPFVLEPRDLELQAGFDPAELQHAEEDLDIAEFTETTRKLLNDTARR
jgi:hypothetical protein